MVPNCSYVPAMAKLRPMATKPERTHAPVQRRGTIAPAVEKLLSELSKWGVVDECNYCSL